MTAHNAVRLHGWPTQGVYQEGLESLEVAFPGPKVLAEVYGATFNYFRSIDLYRAVFSAAWTSADVQLMVLDDHDEPQRFRVLALGIVRLCGV